MAFLNGRVVPLSGRMKVKSGRGLGMLVSEGVSIALVQN
jgi:hypothetical protein